MTDFDRLKGEPAVMAALVAGETRRDAAEAGGITESTVYGRMRDRGYRAELRSRRAAALIQAISRLVDRGLEAVDALVALMRDAESETVWLSAAGKILDSAVRGTETVVLTEELEELRRMFGEDDGGLL